MRDTHNVFHLAIPARDLDEAYDFYVKKLGCKLARRYNDRITLDFFGDQVVCHHSQDYAAEPKEYPRHFGVTFRDRDEFDNLLKLARAPRPPILPRAVPALRGAGGRARKLLPRGPLQQPPRIQVVSRRAYDVLGST